MRPLQIGGGHMCACAPKSERARRVYATLETSRNSPLAKWVAVVSKI